MKNRWLIVLLFLLLCCSGSALAAEISVSPDGTADYATLTEAAAAAQSGDTLLLRAGTYTSPAESFPIVLDKPLTIRAEDGTILDSPPFTTLLEITSDDVSITGVTFQVLKWGIMATQCQRLRLENCTFVLADTTYRTSSTAMWMEAMKHCTIRNCAFQGVGICVAGDPLSASSSGKALLTGLCEVGEDPEYFSSHVIENCTVNGKPLYYIIGGEHVVVPSDAGGIIAAYCDGITVRDADVSDSSMGLEIVHSKNVVLENVVADRCGIFGTYVAFAEGGTFRNVTVRETNHGIDTRASSNIVVEECLSDGCDQGIFFSMCTDCVMQNCEVLNTGFGCFVAVGRGLRIRDCVFEGNADGIYLQNERETTISNCSITGSTVVGLRILKSTGLCENTVLQNNWTGVILYDSENVTLRSCTLTGNEAAGVYAGEARETLIEDCTFSGETTAHFEFEGSFSNTTITGCTLTGSIEEMIRDKSDSLPTFAENVWVP